MLIDGTYFVPDGLYEAVRNAAIWEEKTQCVGLLYAPPIRPSSWLDHFRTGAYCTWLYGPKPEELRAMDRMAALLWIGPKAEKAPKEISDAQL